MRLRKFRKCVQARFSDEGSNRVLNLTYLRRGLIPQHDQEFKFRHVSGPGSHPDAMFKNATNQFYYKLKHERRLK